MAILETLETVCRKKIFPGTEVTEEELVKNNWRRCGVYADADIWKNQDGILILVSKKKISFVANESCIPIPDLEPV